MNRCFLALLVAFGITAVSAQQIKNAVEIVPPKTYAAPKITPSAKLQSVLDAAVDETVAASEGKLKKEEIAATIIDVRDPANLAWASLRGEDRIYPASVVKMFYMAALHRQLEDGKVTATPELMRGMRDMIVDSSNEATQYILDVLTNTSSGAELPQSEFEQWQY